MAIAGEPFLVPCSRGLRKLVRRPDCHRCDQPSSLYWKVYSAISKMVWRIFVACLCQKLAACCIGTGDPRATLRIFQLSTATHCTVNWVKLKNRVHYRGGALQGHDHCTLFVTCCRHPVYSNRTFPSTFLLFVWRQKLLICYHHFPVLARYTYLLLKDLVRYILNGDYLSRTLM